MPSGGHSRSGPAPDPEALRRNRKDDIAGWTVLPASGRAGDPPAWPLIGQSDREVEMWSTFWRKPQALIWERDQLHEVVALFVRQFCEGELPKTSAENRKTIKSYLPDLYLTSDSMLRARLRISVDEVAEKRSVPAKRPSARDRLKALDGEAS